MTTPLRVAVVHSYYSSRQPSGENVVVGLQVEALRRAGHEVRVLARRTDELEPALLYPVRAALRVATGRGADPLDAIEQFDADVVHVHNLFPNYGRTWADRLDRPLVTTLHNYRSICPAGTLLRDGKSCTLCPDGLDAQPAVTYACYRDSKIATWPVARGTRFGRDPLLRRADRVVTLNDDMLGRYAAIGVARERLITVPNFVPASESPGAHAGGYWLYVGRLSPEKGILPVVRDWPAGLELRVAGSGPLDEEVAAAAGPSVRLLGQVSSSEVRALMAEAVGLVFPSLWPEGLPTVYLEALSAGTPVLASPESIVGQLVDREGTGLVATGDLAADLERAGALFPELVARCRAAYEASYTEGAWVAAIERVYAEAQRARK